MVEKLPNVEPVFMTVLQGLLANPNVIHSYEILRDEKWRKDILEIVADVSIDCIKLHVEMNEAIRKETVRIEAESAAVEPRKREGGYEHRSSSGSDRGEG